MTIDPRTRAAVEDLWAHTVADPEEGLAVLFETDVRRRQRGRLGMAAAAAVAVLAGWWGVATFGDHEAPPAPSHVPTVTGSAPGPCHTLYVTCLGGRTYQFALFRPVRWRIPRGYGVNSGAGASIRLVESDRLGPGSHSGVTVLERVRAASAASQAAPGVPATASGFVHWLASRPFLDATTPRQTMIDGHSAWQVRVRLKPGVGPGPGTCEGPGGGSCYPITYQEFVTERDAPGVESAITGIWGDMTADYTAFDLPSGANTLMQDGPAVVWSWAFGHDQAALRHNRVLVDGLSWPGN